MLWRKKKKSATENTEKLVLAIQEKTIALEEKWKELEAKGKEVTKLDAEVALLRSREINQGAFAKMVVKKVLQTIDFGELAIQMSVAATNIGKNEVLKTLMT